MARQSRLDAALWARLGRRSTAALDDDPEFLPLDPTSGALIVTGAGAAPSATALRITDGVEEAQVTADGALLVTVTNPSSGGGGSTGGLTNTELRATPVPVSGTVTVTDGSGPITVDGTVTVANPGLTDAQLRATALPVSGPLTDAQARATPLPVDTGLTPLTNTQLRATPVPVSGTVTVTDGSGPITVDGTVAVSNPGLTDAQLRASAIPVSGTVSITDGSGPVTVDGTVTVSNPGLTDAQLRATPVPVSGTVSTGLTPLTDAQLRATAVPVSNTDISKRFATSVGGPTTCTTTAATTLYTPASGKRIRLKWVGLSSPETNTASTTVEVLLGSTPIYRWAMGAPGAFAHGSVREGAVNETLTLAMSSAQTVYANIDVEEF